MSIDEAILEMNGLKDFLDDNCSTQRALDMAIAALMEKQDRMEMEEDEY